MNLMSSESTGMSAASWQHSGALACLCCEPRPSFGALQTTQAPDRSPRYAATRLATRLKPSTRAKAGGAQGKTSGEPHRIDVHHHVIPPRYVSLVGAERIFRQSGGRVPPAIATWSPQAAIEIMDECGIATSLASVSAPGTWFGDVELSRKVTRECNEYGAQLAADHPGRFGSFAALPLPDIDGSLKEIEYAFDVLKVDGIALMTSYDNRWPGEKEFAPVFYELNRRKAVVFFHPTTPACCMDLITNVPDASIEFLFDTVRAVTSLLYSGTFSRCADTRFIFCHNGSAVPLLKDRICSRWGMARELFEPLIPNGPMHELKKLYFECAGSTFPECFAPLLQMVSANNILVGTDYPWGRLTIEQTLKGLLDQGFSPAELRLIERDNALGLFPRFAKA